MRKEKKMSENAGDEEYRKLTDAAGLQLARVHCGNREYIKWLGENSPFWVRMMSYLMAELAKGYGVLPLPLFKALQEMFLDANRVGYEMWQHRDWFTLYSRPIPPGIN